MLKKEMPASQQSGPNCQVLNPSKSTLVRSKSLRLPTAKSKSDHALPNTLSRHGSIRIPRNQTTGATNSKPHFSVFKKPAIKPKPVFYNSKSTENLDTTNKIPENESRKVLCRSPTKNFDGRSVTFNDNKYSTPSDSPTSMHSDRSQSQDASSSYCSSDLIVHLKRLTEEHEKLQMEYARVRMQLLESASYHPLSSIKKENQHLSHSDSQLSSIPENTCEGNSVENSEHFLKLQKLETLVQNFRIEIHRLQEENRKLQRKYWEQIWNCELLEDETCNDASRQVVDLIDKLDDKEKELLEAMGRIQELENHLAATSMELHQCQVALHDQQNIIDETTSQKEEIAKQLAEFRSALHEAKENIDFLQIERSTLAESLQEMEQTLQCAKTEMFKDQSRNNELMDRARKLYAKVKDKNLQIQLLQAELDRTQGNCRDMLLSQGAELTMTSMHLSQMAISIHSMLTSAADFAATEMELQKEMLEEVMADLDSEGERSDSPQKENCGFISESQIPTAVLHTSTKNLAKESHLDTCKSLPDITAVEPSSPLYSSTSSSSDRPLSLVQSMVRAFEQSSKCDATLSKHAKSLSEQNCDSVKSSCENLSSVNGDLSHISLPSKDNSPQMSSAFKPVGMATAFRPIRQQSIELEPLFPDHLNYEEEKKASLEAQLNQMNYLIKKVSKVIELMQGKFLAKVKLLNEEKSHLQEELYTSKQKQYHLQADVDIKNDLIEKTNEKFEQTSLLLKTTKNAFVEEKESLQQKITALNEKNKCLEAINAEQAEQLEKEVRRILDLASKEPNHDFITNAQSICDKLALKQELAKLKAVISQKEQLLQQMAQKFTCTKSSLEKNLEQSGKEIDFLDGVIGKISSILESNSELVSTHEPLQNILALVSGNCTVSTLKSAAVFETIK